MANGIATGVEIKDVEAVDNELFTGNSLHMVLRLLRFGEAGRGFRRRRKPYRSGGPARGHRYGCSMAGSIRTRA